LSLESELDEEVKGWLAFARQKLEEVAALARAAHAGRDAAQAAFDAANTAIASRAASARIHDPAVNTRVSAVTAADLERQSPYATRITEQQARLKLPAYPTTTIGSFPQTPDVRKARAAHRR